MAIDTRPTTLTNTHQYNLRNQGWPEEFVCAPNRSGNNAAPITTDPITYTKSILGVYPSNADVIYLSRLQGAGEARNLNTYSPWDLDKIIQGNTPAARGHFIINAFDRNRQDVSGISGIYDEDRDVDTSRPISVAFAFGRVWYLMRDGHLYYSQTILQIDQASKCFQEADPTAEDVNELVATDGGEMDVTGIGRAYSLVSAGDELLIMADNGIWSISGGTDTGFTATNQIIRKITTQGVLGPESSCEVEGAVFYWGEGGIYLLTPSEATGFLQATNISETTIQTLYIAIPENGKKYCRVKYDPRTKKIFWMYNDTEDYDGVNFRYAYNKFLVFDTTIQAFYTYSIAYDLDNLPFVAGLIEKESIAFELEQENVTNSGTTVTNGGITVTTTVSTAVSSEVRLKVFTLVKNPDTVITFAGAGSITSSSGSDTPPSVTIEEGIDLDENAKVLAAYFYQQNGTTDRFVLLIDRTPPSMATPNLGNAVEDFFGFVEVDTSGGVLTLNSDDAVSITDVTSNPTFGNMRRYTWNVAKALGKSWLSSPGTYTIDWDSSAVVGTPPTTGSFTVTVEDDGVIGTNYGFAYEDADFSSAFGSISPDPSYIHGDINSA